MQAPIRIGTRGSDLALAQAHEVKDRLLGAHDDYYDEDITIHIFKTTGDSILDRNLSEIGGKGLFTKEIEEALLANEVDIAVHSMKDVPAILPDGLSIECVLPREDCRDAFLSLDYHHITDLPEGATVGTSSSRRQAQLLHARPDLNIVPFRGNVNTRLRKLEEGQVDATILAAAGLNRLGLHEMIKSTISAEWMVPAVCQGVIGIECRSDDAHIIEVLEPLNDTNTAITSAAERAFLETLEGSCKTPLAALATLEGNSLTLNCLLASTDGKIFYRAHKEGDASDAGAMGVEAANDIKQQAGEAFFASLMAS